MTATSAAVNPTMSISAIAIRCSSDSPPQGPLDLGSLNPADRGRLHVHVGGRFRHRLERDLRPQGRPPPPVTPEVQTDCG